MRGHEIALPSCGYFKCVKTLSVHLSVRSTYEPFYEKMFLYDNHIGEGEAEISYVDSCGFRRSRLQHGRESERSIY